jgi:hypothetical protein
MGTPHGGAGPNSKVLLGNLCAKIARKVCGNASNDLIEAVESGSLFSDTLTEHFRHQLENYQVISCYETLGQVCEESR